MSNAGQQAAAPQQPGPGQMISTWWRGLPLGVRGLMSASMLVYTLSWFAPVLLLAFCPSILISNLFMVWTFLTSFVTHMQLLQLLISMWFLHSGTVHAERGRGTIPLLYTVFAIVAVINVLLFLLYASLQFVPWFLIHMGVGGCHKGTIPTMFSLMVYRAHTQQEAPPRSCCGFFNIPNQAYPYFLLVLFQVMTPQMFLLPEMLGVVVGWLWAHGRLGFLELSQERAQRLEHSPKLTWLTSASGYVPVGDHVLSFGDNPMRDEEQGGAGAASSSGGLGNVLGGGGAASAPATSAPGFQAFAGSGNRLGSDPPPDSPTASASTASRTRGPYSQLTTEES